MKWSYVKCVQKFFKYIIVMQFDNIDNIFFKEKILFKYTIFHKIYMIINDTPTLFIFSITNIFKISMFVLLIILIRL